MNFKSQQEIFDFVAAHLVKQGHRAIGRMGGCRYRIASGESCAVGCIIPDELYSPQMEMKGVRNLISLAKFQNYSLPDYIYDNEDFLAGLQAVHDTESNWSDIKYALKGFALIYGVDASKVEAL